MLYKKQVEPEVARLVMIECYRKLSIVAVVDNDAIHRIIINVTIACPQSCTTGLNIYAAQTAI